GHRGRFAKNPCLTLQPAHCRGLIHRSGSCLSLNLLLGTDRLTWGHRFEIMLIVVIRLAGMTPLAGQRIDKIVALAAAVALAAIANRYPSASFAANARDHHAWAILLLLVISGIFTAIGPVEILASKSAVKDSIAYQHQILSALGRMLDIAKTVD